MSNRLAIEIGGTKLQAAIGTSQGQILQLEKCSVPRDSTATDVRKLVMGIVQKLGNEWLPEQIGIGFGGPIDAENGRVVRSHQIEGWDDFPLQKWAKDQFGLPCVIENDTNCGALAEARLGAGTDSRVVFYTNIGSGIGGGLVINGELYKRSLGAAEIGHTKLWDPATSRYVAVEDLCSGWAIERKAREKVSEGKLTKILSLAGERLEDITARHVGRIAAEGDPEALRIISEAAEKFAIALCNMIALLNPDKIVVGGGISLLGDLFFEPLRAAIEREVFQPYAQNFQIVPAAFGEDMVTIGALLI